jgi:hypothetical protein
LKFILELWPDSDDPTPEELLRYALDSIQANPGLVWDIEDDSGKVLHSNVTLGPTPWWMAMPPPDDGTSGQDRESYTDDQDRSDYTT